MADTLHATIGMETLNANCGVYLIVSPTGGRYVGSSKDLRKRFNRYKNCSCNRQTAIFNSIKKYGYEAHAVKVLMYCPESDLLYWERVFGDLYRSMSHFPQGLNLVLPDYGDKARSLSSEMRQRISDQQKRRYENEEERRRTGERSRKAYSNPDLRAKVSNTHKERYKDPALRQQRSEVRKAYYQNNPEARKKVSEKTKAVMEARPELKAQHAATLKKYYQENPDKVGIYAKTVLKGNKELGAAHSERLKKYYQDNPEARKILSESTKAQLAKHGHPMAKKVIDTSTGEVFASSKLAAAKLNVAENTFRNWLRGVSPNPTAYRYL